MRNLHCWILAAVIMAVLALAGLAEGATLDGTDHCDGYPEWDERYAALRGFTAKAGEAIMWFEEQGCTLTGTDPEGWPECDDSIACDGTVTVDVSDAATAHAEAVARAQSAGLVQSARSAAQAAVGRPGTSQCAVMPIMSVTPLSAPAGASITASLINSATSSPFQITGDQRAAWAVTPGGDDMLITHTDTTRSTFTVQSAGAGSATIAVEVCGEARTATVAWSARTFNTGPMIKSIVTIVGVVVGVAIGKAMN